MEFQKLTGPQFRTVNHKVELRMSDGQESKNTVFGYAAKFESPTTLMDWGDEIWIETIDRGFFDNVLKDDVRALIDHNSTYNLARTASGTLKIGTDDIGLWYSFEIPNRTYALDLRDSLEKGDIDQSSFGFMLNSDGIKYEEKQEGDKWVVRRTLLKGGCKRLMDVSPVTYPAYESTEVGLRAFNAGLEDYEKGLSQYRDKNNPQSNAKQININKELIEIEILGL